MTNATTVRIVPRRSLLVSGLASILLVMLPVSAVLYWFTIPRGQGGWVVLAQGIALAASFAVLLRQLSVDTVVADGELRGRGIFSPMVRVRFDEIARADLVPVFVGQSPEIVPQLLVRAADGSRLFRLRGNFWRPGDLERVAAALPVPLTVVQEPMALTEFFAAYPGSAYWFENRPALMAALLAIVIIACVAIAVVIMTLAGMPIRT